MQITSALNNKKTATDSQNMINSLVEHRFYIFSAALFHIAVTVFLSNTLNHPTENFFLSFLKFLARSTVVFGVATFAIYLALILIRKRPDGSLFKFTYEILRDRIFNDGNFWRILFGIVGLSLVISAFVILKASIPKIQPFVFDQTFEELDRLIHFGHQPWVLLQPILGHEYVTLLLHRLYYLWFPVIFMTFFWQIASRNNNKLRLQFIASFIACWALLGGVMATLLSSAGPIYFDRVVLDAPDPYQNAMHYLTTLHDKHDLYMFKIREYLWFFYENPDQSTDIKGISAMPSMHVSIAFLLMLFGFRIGRYVGLAYTAFFVAIFLGSIHLLWHYAVDGYVSILATWIIWRVCGTLAKAD